MTESLPTPRRSVLFMPGANERALEKAAQLDCDGLIFDLEDAVAPAAKVQARARVAAALSAQRYGSRECILRVNGLDTPWGEADVEACADLPLAGVLFPKINSAADVQGAAAALARAGRPELPLWLMIESAASILALEAISVAAPGVAVLVAGTADLVRDLRARHTPGRESVLYALSRTVTVARAAHLDVLDGVHLDFRNLDSFRATCQQGRALGFDGRTLIHPGQIAIANEVYGISPEEVAHARAVRDVWEAALAAGRGVAELDGQLIEHFHAAQAQRVLALAAVQQCD